jgi:hypothetical protein
MLNPRNRKGWFIINEIDTVEDMGPSEITDPYKEYTFQAGYVSNPSKGIVTVHFPKEIENIDVVWVPVDLLENIDESMYSIWKVRAMKVVHAETSKKTEGTRYTLSVKEVLEIIPITEVMILERSLKDVRYDQKGIYVKMMLKAIRYDRNGTRIQVPSEEIFILNKDLPFRSRDRLNIRKKDLVGRIQISMKYRLTGRWNIHKSVEETKWMRVGIEKIELTDRVALLQIKRFSEDEENLRSPEQK